VEIARSSVASQAYVVGRSLGMQFHPEVVSSTVEAWLHTDGLPALERDGQDGPALVAMTKAFDEAASQRAHLLVDNFLTRVAKLV
jgi:GMP synthase-like glutamine amidotransferase